MFISEGGVACARGVDCDHVRWHAGAVYIEDLHIRGNGGAGLLIDAAVDDVTIRNVTMEGVAVGVHVGSNCGTCRVILENVSIRSSFKSVVVDTRVDALVIRNSTLAGGITGLSAPMGAGEIHLTDTQIVGRGVGNGIFVGIQEMPTRERLERVTISGHGVAAVLDRPTIDDTIVYCVDTGIDVAGGGTLITPESPKRRPEFAVVIRGLHVEGCAGHAVHFLSVLNATLHKTVLSGNDVGLWAYFGIAQLAMDGFILEDNRVGLDVHTTGVDDWITLDHGSVHNNSEAGAVLRATHVRVHDVDVTGNGLAPGGQGGLIISAQYNMFEYKDPPSAVVRNSSFLDNTPVGIAAPDGFRPVDASFNWWGAPAGPVPTAGLAPAPPGTERYSGPVVVHPVLTQPPSRPT